LGLVPGRWDDKSQKYFKMKQWGRGGGGKLGEIWGKSDWGGGTLLVRSEGLENSALGIEDDRRLGGSVTLKDNKGTLRGSSD